MNLQRLRAFAATMQLGSVTKAADSLHLSQPAVSRLLGALETEIGFRLFVRERGRLLPTSEGHRFFAKCEIALGGIDGLTSVAREIGAYRDGTLTILCTPQSGYTVFPEVVGRFSKRYPKIKINLNTVQRSEVAHASRHSHYDIGFTALPVDHPSLILRNVFTLPALALLPIAKRKPRNKRLFARDFDGQDFVMLTPHNLIRPQVELFFAREQIKVRSMIETSSPIIAYKLVSQGFGMSIVDPFSPMFMASKEVYVSRVNADIHLTYGFFFPDNRPISALSEGIMSIFQDVVASAIRGNGLS